MARLPRDASALGLRGLSPRRVLALAGLGCGLLLLSVAMLRSSDGGGGGGPGAPRTFRDGFIVAEHTRRTESVGGGGGPPALLLRGGNAKKSVVSTAVDGEQQLTTITTEDGDEITIKRGAKSNKITTISAHEDGKITIENRDEGPTTTAPTTAAPPTSTPVAVAHESDREGVTKTPVVTKGRGVTLAEDVENTAGAVEHRIEDDKAPPPAPAAAADGARKTVTVVEVGRAETKVSVREVTEENDKEHDDKHEPTDKTTTITDARHRPMDRQDVPEAEA